MLTKVHLVKAMVFPVVMYETTQRDGIGRQEGWGFRMDDSVYLWQIHVDVWQNQYNIVK